MIEITLTGPRGLHDYFRDICGLELKEDLWARAQAWEDTLQSACWWWPHHQFVIVSERPRVIQREQIGPRGWGSHRLHCEEGPAVAFKDWAIWAWHGVRVPQRVIENPDSLTANEILAEPNAEVRRVMHERVLDWMDRIADDSFGELYRADLADDEPLYIVAVRDPSTGRRYLLRVDPDAYGGLRSARAAVASTWRNSNGSLAFAWPDDYVLAGES